MFGTIDTKLQELAVKWPEKDAILSWDDRLTYAQLSLEANKAANYFLSLGVSKGDNVGMLIRNCAEFAIALMGLQKIGAVACLWNFRLASADIAYLINTSKARAVVFNDEFLPVVKEASKKVDECALLCAEIEGASGGVRHFRSEIEPCSSKPPAVCRPGEDDYTAVIYTSGTMGKPKGAAFTNRAQFMSAIQYCLEMGLDRSHVGMSMAPVIHGAALNFYMAYFTLGAAFVMTGRADPERVLQLVERFKVTELFAVPPQMEAILAVKGRERYDLASLRLVRSGGSLIPKSLSQRLTQAFSCHILNTYGMTENLSNTTTFHTGIDPWEKRESMGKASHFWQIRVIKDDRHREVSPEEVVPVPGRGQVIIKGPQTISSYYQNQGDEVKIRDGWFYTRDIVEVDSDGYMYIVDRVDNIIKSGAQNIYPQEVESVLLKNPDIQEAVVLGVPDEKWGETVLALIKPKTQGLTPEKIDSYCRQSKELANFKRPRIFEFVDSLPRNVFGKVEREKLKKIYSQKYSKK